MWIFTIFNTENIQPPLNEFFSSVRFNTFHFLRIVVGSTADFVLVLETRIVAVVCPCFLPLFEFDEWIDSVGEAFDEGDLDSRFLFRVNVPWASILCSEELLFSSLIFTLGSFTFTFTFDDDDDCGSDEVEFGFLLLLLFLSRGCKELKISSENMLCWFSMRLSLFCKFCRSHVVLCSWMNLSISLCTFCRFPICIENCWYIWTRFFIIGSLFLSFRFTFAAFSSVSWTISSFSRPSIRLFSNAISFFRSSVKASLGNPPFAFSKSWIRSFSLWFSSLYECNCRFHSSTFAVDS